MHRPIAPHPPILSRYIYYSVTLADNGTHVGSCLCVIFNGRAMTIARATTRAMVKIQQQNIPGLPYLEEVGGCGITSEDSFQTGPGSRSPPRGDEFPSLVAVPWKQWVTFKKTQQQKIRRRESLNILMCADRINTTKTERNRHNGKK